MTILDLFYFGKENVYNKDLESFLAIAEELKLKGLKRKTSAKEVEEEKSSRPIGKMFRRMF